MLFKQSHKRKLLHANMYFYILRVQEGLKYKLQYKIYLNIKLKNKQNIWIQLPKTVMSH